MSAIIRRSGALIAALLCAVATFVIVSSVGAGFWLLALLALMAFLAVGWALLRMAGTSRKATRMWLGLGGLAYVLLAQLFVGRAPQQTLVYPVPTPETKYWTMQDGQRLAYEVVTPTSDSGRPPIIVLQDAPGIPELPFIDQLGKRPYDFLRDHGWTVYYYDQIGSGLSSRLDLTHETPYTVSRHVEDLEGIRQQIGAERVVLAGIGWGSTLAVQYLLKHTEHVERLILESPAAIWAPAWPQTINPAARAKLTDVQASAMAALERPPLRLTLGRMMADFNPSVAHLWIPDWEADQWWTKRTAEAIQLGQPNLTCKSNPGEAGIPTPSGLGFFANSYTLANALTLPDPRPLLKKAYMETLVIRGMCDYVDWPVSAEYLQLLKGTHYVSIPAAGHYVWLEQPYLFQEVVSAFLRGEKPPLEIYDPGAASGAPRSTGTTDGQTNR